MKPHRTAETGPQVVPRGDVLETCARAHTHSLERGYSHTPLHLLNRRSLMQLVAQLRAENAALKCRLGVAS